MSAQTSQIFIGTAGWAIPKSAAEMFPDSGSHLERYAQVLTAAEINSSFYRPHKPQTYEKWANLVPGGFKFAVKLPKAITHERRLQGAGELLDRFLDEANALGSRLGPLLVQLPPSLKFDSVLAAHFFDILRDRFEGQVVCEPRHASWFAGDVEKLLSDFQVARVAADPFVVPQAGEPGGWNGLAYFRLHGSPRMYYSAYSAQYLDVLSEKLRRQSAQGAAVWCVFDNTAEGAATLNALDVLKQIAA